MERKFDLIRELEKVQLIAKRIGLEQLYICLKEYTEVISEPVADITPKVIIKALLR